MVRQVEIRLKARAKGFHLVTTEILTALGELPEAGILQLFLQHTSAALSINENADPTVRRDLKMAFENLVPQNWPYAHNDEGSDDMPAHVMSVLTGASITMPIMSGRLALGTWQGIYLCEFRDRGGERKIVATILT